MGLLEHRVSELRRLPITRNVGLPRSGLDAGWRVLQRFGSGDETSGTVDARHQYGGSVPEGYRLCMTVVLPDALVEVEEFEDMLEANTFAAIYAPTEARADELEVVLRAPPREP